MPSLLKGWVRSLTGMDLITGMDLNITGTAVVDLEGVRRVQLNPSLSPNYFIFMGNFEKKYAKW